MDDYVPVGSAYRHYDNHESETAEVPLFAHSAHYGEIWPMIAEKAWAKLIGSYEWIVGGSNEWVLAHLTNDPVETIVLTGQTATQADATWT